jgi:hypothetical protein
MPELPEKLNKIEIENELKNLEGDLTRDNLDENIKLYEFLKNEGRDLSKQRAEQKLKDVERIKELKAQLDTIKEEPGQDVKPQDTGTNLTEEKPNDKEVSAEETKDLTVENKSEKEKGQEIKTYSVDFIKSKVLSLIGGIKEIGSVEKFDIVGLEKNITINTTVTSWGFDINVKIEIENEDNGIVIKKYNIDAKWPAKGKAEKALVPRLGEISEMLKNYIEKEEGKKVEKMEIENGELKVDFKKENTYESNQEEPDKKVDDIPETQPEKIKVTTNFFEDKDVNMLNDLTEHYNKIINDPLVEKDNSEHAKRQLALIEDEKKRRNGLENIESIQGEQK